jgi:4-amino-4-deoxy-L-arabinose transferase-like glycosyltransferase
VPKQYLAYKGFQPIPGNVFAGYPLLGEMHYLLALFYSGEMLAKAMHWALLALTLGGIGLYALTHLRARVAQGIALLSFLSIPTVYSVGHMAYNDLFLTFFTWAALYAFQRWSEEERTRSLILCAFFVGAAAGTKYIGLFLVLLGCLGILWQAYRSGSNAPKALRQLAIFTTVSLLVASPFYLKNWVTLGNPLYPFFYGWFGGLGWDAHQARLYDLFIAQLGMGHSWSDYLLLPWNVSFRAEWDSPRFDGILGPIFLLTLPFLFFVRPWPWAVRVLTTYSFFAFLFWAFTAQQVRYLLPMLPATAVLLGFLFQNLSQRRPLFILLVLILLGSLSFNLLHIAGEFQRIKPWKTLAGLESRETFLARMIPSFPMYQRVNQTLPESSRVYLIYMRNFTYLCEKACYSDSLFEAHSLQKILRESTTPRQIRDRLVQSGFTHLLYNEQVLLGGALPSPKMNGSVSSTFASITSPFWNSRAPIAWSQSNNLRCPKIVVITFPLSEILSLWFHPAVSSIGLAAFSCPSPIKTTGFHWPL